MFLIKTLFSIYLLVAISVEQSSSFCKPFDQSSGLAALCGYSATVNFTHQSHYDSAVKNVKDLVQLFGSCSDYAKLIICSWSVPRCESYIEGPYLPCRRVCDEFDSKCGSKIALYGMQVIIGNCQLLPEKDNPNTTLGYRGRCFEPPNFKTSIVKSPPLKCHNLVAPVCQNLGYTRTILPEENQKAHSSWVSDQLKAVKDKPECDVPRKKLFCMENFPPCVNDTKVGSYCQPKCERFYNMSCTPAIQTNDITKCMEFPGGTADNDVCSYTHWPKAMNWPQVRGTPKPAVISIRTTQKPASTDTRRSVTTESVIFSSKPTSTEMRVNKTDHNPNLEESNKPKMAAVIGGVFAVLFVIVIALAIGFIIYRKRSKSRNSSRNRRKKKDKTANKLLRY